MKALDDYEDMNTPEQLRLKKEFIDEHVLSSIKFRNRGLHGVHRGSAFLISALAVLDIEFQRAFGCTTTEEQFVMLARLIHQERQKMFRTPGGPS